MGKVIAQGVRRPKAGQTVCGDQFGRFRLDDRSGYLLAIVDGLGHGVEAQVAAEVAIAAMGPNRHLGLTELAAALDRDLRQTRGVALGMARIDLQRRRLTYFGVGNIRAALVANAVTRFSNNYGIVGGGIRSLRLDLVDISGGEHLVMFTDGVNDAADMDLASLASAMSPAQMAVTILGEWGTEADDAAVLAAKVIV